MKYLASFVLIMFIAAPAAFADDVQRAACFYPKSASNSPVQVIYMSGLFPPGDEDDPRGYIDLEENNRDYLSSLADKLNIKIAVPLAPIRNLDDYGDQHAWNLVALSAIEKGAVSACQAPLSLHRVLLGFSSGAIRIARMLDDMKCASFKKYNGIFVIGAEGVNGPQQGKCGRTVFEASEHDFPPTSINLPTKLKKIIPKKPTQDPASPAVQSQND